MTRSELLSTAGQMVCGSREHDHGSPENNFYNIGRFWTQYIFAAKHTLVNFDAEDVAVMMALMKIARISTNKAHVDSWVDAAGYIACGAEIVTGGDKHSKEVAYVKEN